MSHPVFDVEGKVILVTGSARGLGAAFAHGFLEAGARVVLNSAHEESMAAAQEKLRGEGYDVPGYCFDISDETAVTAAIARIEEEVGPIDVLVNNAGIQRRKPLLEVPAEPWREVLEGNLTGAFLVGRAAAVRMAQRGHGKIINVTSLNAALARTGIAPYCSAKGGLKMLTQSMATEWGEYGINVNAIGPGYFDTEMTAPLVQDPEFDAWVRSEVPLRRWGRPSDLVGTALFLASAASDYVDGQTIFVDGGWQACL